MVSSAVPNGLKRFKLVKHGFSRVLLKPHPVLNTDWMNAMFANQIRPEPLLYVVPGKQTKTLSNQQFIELQLTVKLQSTGILLQQLIKRIFDIAASALGLIALSPILLSIALLIKLTSRGPVLYCSERIGKHGQSFGMYKFRTMVLDADSLRAELRDANQQSSELFKLKDDPRITPIGSFLRRFSLDEFPQLLNVLKGDMSLVGPRPFAPDDSALFVAPYTVRFRVIPGMTGLWQVSGRSNLNFQQMCELEIRYIRNWSLWQDLKILCRTIPAVLAAKGAY